MSQASQVGRIPWNKGRLIGPKPPLKPKHVWGIRIRLQLADAARDLAMFDLAIDRLPDSPDRPGRTSIGGEARTTDYPQCADTATL